MQYYGCITLPRQQNVITSDTTAHFVHTVVRQPTFHTLIFVTKCLVTAFAFLLVLVPTKFASRGAVRHVEIIADWAKNRASKRGCCFFHGLRMQFSPLIRNLSLYKTTPLIYLTAIKGSIPQKWRIFFYDICH